MISTVYRARPFVLALITFAAIIAALDAQAPRPTPTLVWAPKPTSTPAYTSPQKPWVKLADVKARHARDANWRELIVDDGRLTGEYVAAAAGTKTDRRFHPDTREWFAVVGRRFEARCLIPARPASRANPMTALKAE